MSKKKAQEFDAEKLLKALDDHNWRSGVLLSCSQLGITTREVAEKYVPDNSNGYRYSPTRQALDWLVAPPKEERYSPLLEVRTPKLPGKPGRPPNLWVLTQTGADMLNRLAPGRKIKAPSLRDAWDVTHRFYMLKVLESAKSVNMLAQGEYPLTAGGNGVRADVYAEWGDLKITIEIEQKLSQKNFLRAVRKFENWENYIRGKQAKGEDCSWRMYLVFSIAPRELPELLDKWRMALGQAIEKLGGLSYDVRYRLAYELFDVGALDLYLEDAELLEPDRSDDVYQIDWEDEQESEEPPEWIDQDLYVEFEDAMEAVCSAERGEDLPALIRLATVIHQASYHEDSLAANRAVFPRESIWLMRRYLNHPWTRPARKKLATKMDMIGKHNPGMVILRDTVTSVIWDVLLYHHGLGRGGAMRAVFQTPDFKDITSDFHVDVHIGGDIRGNLEEAEKALGWFLSSLYLYRDKLGLNGNSRKKPKGE